MRKQAGFRPRPDLEVKQWNEAMKIGDLVDYEAYPGAKPERYPISTAAEVLQGHTAVVWLEGKSGCVALSHCKPVAA